VTLKTGLMMLKIQLCNYKKKKIVIMIFNKNDSFCWIFDHLNAALLSMRYYIVDLVVKCVQILEPRYIADLD